MKVLKQINLRSVCSYLIHTGICAWIWLYCLTFLVILPILCYNIPYSSYYRNKPDLASIKKLNDYRSRKAMITLNKLKNNGIIQTEHSQRNIDIAIGVITVVRQQTSDSGSTSPKYVTQVVAKLLEERNKTGMLNITIFMCNVDSDPLHHKDAMSLAELVPMVTKYSSGRAQEIDIFDTYNKENKDYIFCLNETMKYGAKYSLLLEDDAVPKDNFFGVLRHLTRKERFGRNNVSLLKLYYPERWQGYSRDNMYAIVDLIAMIFIFGPLLTGIMYRLHHQRHLTLHLVLSTIYVTVVLYVVGRQTLMSFRQLHEQLHVLRPAHGCCTPGVLFTRIFSQKLVLFLDKVTCSKDYPLDIAIADFEKQLGYNGFNVIPNIISHIGSISSLPKTEDIKKISLS